MNPKNINYTNPTDIDAKMRAAALIPISHFDPSPEYLRLRDQSRRDNSYAVTVDENLLTIHHGKDMLSDEEVGGHVIPLPHIRGVSSIHKRYTKGSGSSVNLLAFSITVVGLSTPINIYQGEPFMWFGKSPSPMIHEDIEMLWHKNQLINQRHEVLAALNAYINRVRNLEPEDRQLKLGL